MRQEGSHNLTHLMMAAFNLRRRGLIRPHGQGHGDASPASIAAAVGRGDGCNHFQELHLRSSLASCRCSKGGSSADAAGYRGIEKKNGHIDTNKIVCREDV